jgi:hypothetical protein
MDYALPTTATAILRIVLRALGRGGELLGAVFIDNLHVTQVFFI